MYIEIPSGKALKTFVAPSGEQCFERITLDNCMPAVRAILTAERKMVCSVASKSGCVAFTLGNSVYVTSTRDLESRLRPNIQIERREEKDGRETRIYHLYYKMRGS